MDPRHPELAISRMRELMEQYDRVEKDMKEATTSARLAELEREGGLVIQEICLVAPRIHEAMMQTSRQRRHDLTHEVVNLGIRVKYEQPFESLNKSEELGNGFVKGAIGLEEKPVEKVPEIASEGVLEVIEVAKKNAEAKKKTTKKKPAKKAKK